MNNVNIFIGSDRAFEEYITGEKIEFNTLRDIIDILDIKWHKVDGHNNQDMETKIFENVIIGTDEYALLNEWAVNSIDTVLNNSKVVTNKLYLCNPPQKIIFDLERLYKEKVNINKMGYTKINNSMIRKMYKQCSKKIIGQELAIREILTCIYSLKYQDKPIVILMNGKSGIGKTETAKTMCDCLGAEPTRIQFSMYQNNEAYNYIFGGEYSKQSLARDLIRRETNIIHIDEFDKVNSVFFNAFYQMFDEGIFMDKNYTVDVSPCIFLCTSNFKDSAEIKKVLGEPLYSRFDYIVEFKDLSIENRKKIAENTFRSIVSLLGRNDQKIINKSNLLNRINTSIEEGNYRNIRTLKKDVQLLINMKLIDTHNLFSDN